MAGLIPPSTLEQIRGSNDIVDVIGSYFPLKRAGANFVALCPFHKEKSPSFNVNPHRQIFHCFGCHKGGDVFSFVREYENLTFVEAVQRLADRARIPLEFNHDPAQQQTRQLKDQLLEIHEKITTRWHGALLNESSGETARAYLAKRGVSEEAIRRFRLGSASEAWDDTVNWAKAKGYPLEVMEKAGLVLRKEGSNHFYDRFRGRLIFPISDEQGRVIGFSGRLLQDDVKAAKYVNSPETILFRKGKVFFGLDKARRAILDAGHAVICEGQLDLIACHMAGIAHVVAPQGTALTVEHARILKRYVEEIIVCFDSDDAGQNAALRSLETVQSLDLGLRVALIPAPHDPDSFLREHGAEAFRALLAGARQYFDFLLERLCKGQDLTTDRGRLAVLKEMAGAVQKTGNQVLIDTYAQKTAQQLGVEPGAVRQEFRKRTPHPAYVPSMDEPLPEPQEETEQEDWETPPAKELWLLKILLLHEELIPWVQERFQDAWLQHGPLAAIIRRRLELSREGAWKGLPAFLDEFAQPRWKQLITEAASTKRTIPDPEKVIKGEGSRISVLEILRNEWIDRQLQDLRTQASQADLSDAMKVELHTRMETLRKNKREPLTPSEPAS